MFFHHEPARGYDLNQVEQGDSVLIGFKGGAQFRAIVIHEPSDFRCDVLDANGIQLDVPATLILSHTPRGHWHESRTQMAA